MLPESLSGISAFVTVAQLGSFTAAAERLGVTKSAVGKSIKRLETRLGVRLIHRTTRRLRLTFDGEAYFKACSLAMESIAAVEARITSNDQVLRGRIHVDMPIAFGRRVLMPILLKVAEPHPHLQLTMTFNDGVIDPMQVDADLVVRFGQLQDSSHLVARKLASQQRIICASPAYLERRGVPATPDDLINHSCIVGTEDGPPQHWTVRDGGRSKLVTPPATHRLSDGESIVETAAAGFGLCQMPISLLRDKIQEGHLVPVLSDYSDVNVDVHLIWLREASLAPRVRYVIDCLVEHAQSGALD
ncbi:MULTISPECIES: LysR family transcriptional regulator [Gammaproteobacteria]|uniref:LysR family transcriptional regulator n=1 Tax=Gammaproteobacteria TaxID=1236 RepID=UPI00112E6B38|nr:LysR family transcriptional regulator [Pseudomonas sp. Hp2]